MVGEILRKRREELGQDLREIASTLKIRYDYLKAIEDEAFEKLPVEVYIRGYIREYAKILDLDPEIAIKAYIQQVSAPQTEKKEVTTEKIVGRRRLKLRYLVIPSLLVLLMITVAFVLFPSTPKKPKIPSHPETKKESVSQLKGVNKNNFYALKDTLHILEISATDTTWLLVNIDKTKSREMLLKTGESVKLYAKEGFSLKIGNADGVRLVFDGKEIGKLGEKGQVVRLNLP